MQPSLTESGRDVEVCYGRKFADIKRSPAGSGMGGTDCRMPQQRQECACVVQGKEISEKTYYYWQRRLYQQMVFTAEGVDFVEIPREVQTGQSPGAAVKVCLSGATIEVYPGADAQMIQVILETLKSC